MGQILIAHCKVVVTSSPDEINPYERLGLKLNDRVVGLLREKCDAIGLAKRETIATKDQSSGKYKAYYTGKHHLLTAPSAHYDSKSRFILPDPLPLSWNDFKTAFLERETGAAEEIYAKILTEAEKVTDASMKAKILTTVERDKANTRQLIKHLNLLNERLSKKENS